ncbi:MAG: OmpA family protein [Planctomycetes bacterium]|nr:OmpA family protein [Planctomycetota bacterium]
MIKSTKHRILFFLIALLPLGACVSSERYSAASNEIENQDEVIRGLRDENGRLVREMEAARNQLELARLEVERLKGNEAAVAELQRLRGEFEKLKGRYENLDSAISVRQTPEGTALSVEGEVLFETASDKISERGAELLRKIADRLLEGQAAIRVDGHTDNVPIVRNTGRYPRGNLQLSGARSLAVAWFLIKECGLAEDRVYYAGYGAERPVASNDDEDGRRRNRRVEIILLGE